MISLIKLSNINSVSVVIAASITIIVFTFRNVHELIDFFEFMTYDYVEGKYIEKYGKVGKVYAYARVKRLNVEDVSIERNNKVKIFIPTENVFVEGIFIGVDIDRLLYIRRDQEIEDNSGDVISYDIDSLRKRDIIYVKPLI